MDGDETIAYSSVIDNRPYFPNLIVSANDENGGVEKSVLEVVSLCPRMIADVVTPVAGGNTNALFCVEGRTGDDSVLVRLFGAEGMIDRDVETSTFASLADQGLSLKYYGRFGNGRVEEMLRGWNCLTESDMMVPVISDEIARQLAKLHSTYKVPDHLREYHDTNPATAEPTLWTQLYPWLEQAINAKFQTENDTDRAANLRPSLANLKREIDWLKLKVINPKSLIGFCHNDLLASNIMMMKDNNDDGETTTVDRRRPRLQFIDFEYGGVNYYAYDIANHFNEYAGGTAVEDDSTPDYGRCPSEGARARFIECYVQEFNANFAAAADGNNTNISVDELKKEVDGFVLANHLVWGLWGVLQASLEGCADGLDYMQYAKCRFERYLHDKQKYNAHKLPHEDS